MAKGTPALGAGLDIGTMNIVGARQGGDGGIGTKRIRDVFLDLPLTAKRMLKMSGVDYIERDDEILIIGDAALETANVFGKEPRRPLSNGLVSPKEPDSLEVLATIIKGVLGPPTQPNEVCFFSVPAAPVDAPSRDVIYHQGVLERIVNECGYDGIPSNEAMAIIYAETAAEGFSGLGVSFGCLTPDTEIMTEHGLSQISSVQEGDLVLTRTGQFSPVQKTWVKHHQGDVFEFDFYGNPNGVTLTGNHEVWVLRDGGWLWVPAEDVCVGDVVGEPVLHETVTSPHVCYTDRTTCGPKRKVMKTVSLKMARFLGYWLADGHLQGQDKNRKNRSGIYVTFGPDEHDFVEDLQGLVADLFDRQVHVYRHGNALRCSFAHRGMHGWLNRRCYDSQRKKMFPFRADQMTESAALGFLAGLARGDGWVGEGHVSFSNSSTSLAVAFHLLAGRLGLTSTLFQRPGRSATFKSGRSIRAEDTLPETTVNVSGLDGLALAYTLKNLPSKVVPKVRRVGGFRCTKIRAVTRRPYDGPVHDLTINGDHSFVAPMMTLHNSGMSNVALAVNTIEGLTFSVARGGDWIDAGAANSVGSTKARMCALKESGIDLNNPKNREEEAICFYYKHLIEYVLDQVAQRFKLIQGQFALPKPIPIVIGGGTSQPTGFVEFFKKVFEKKRKRFPIEVSDIRHASDPLNCVAHGLLVLARQEYEDD